MNKLGSVEWNKTKAKVHGAVEEIAKDLVELYSIRQNQKGYAFGPDTVWQKEFEEMFPYEETDDQLNAIADTKADMESTRIMDRLICGDVGYGKTEVAIRAAFKAVQEGKQVAYLVPTTILAQQHFNTFEQRMKNFPLKVAQLSSFRTNKEIKETLADLKKGFVDVVIGTHRLLSKDVEFKDLGLLIIDEEQRFGVAHKEKIKKLKNNIDVLTLSATPIPRTLHMSLVGIRDMSVLEEPPVDRVPIQTFVTEHNDEMIREAINRELARGGQVYYVYNRVRSIDEAAAHIQELVPQANVDICLRNKFLDVCSRLIYASDTIVYIIHLPTSCKLSVYRLANHLIVMFRHKCLNRDSVYRWFFKHTHIPYSDKAHVKRSWYRRCTERKNINIIFQFLDFFLVCHTKTLLLVYYEKSEVFEFYIF